jgi:hemerythrin-like domain-containing protein
MQRTSDVGDLSDAPRETLPADTDQQGALPVSDEWEQYKDRFRRRPETYEAYVDVWRAKPEAREEFKSWALFSRMANAEPKLRTTQPDRVLRAERIMREAGYEIGQPTRRGARRWIKRAAMTTLGDYNTDVSDMFAAHKALTGALDAAPAYVAKAGLDAERVEVIGSFYANVIEFLHAHHTGEDELIYPLLEQRCAGSRSELERIDEQHKLLYAPMEAGRAALTAWRAAPSTDNADTVLDAIASIAEPLRSHLVEEETVMLPIATKWMSAEEWARMPGHSMMIFRGDKPWLPLGLVREQFNQEQRDAMLAGMPPEMRTAWTEQMEPAFNAFITEVRQ